jgi:hypothetical protein
LYANGTDSWSFDWDTRSVVDGLHTISAIASDGTYQSVVDMVTVTVDNEGEGGYVDLIVTDVWFEDDLIYYQVRNIGNGTCSGGHFTGLLVDGVFQVSDLVDVVLNYGERFTSSFDYSWECSSLNDSVLVVADYENDIDEFNEKNNDRLEFWKCDNRDPVITLGPLVQDITQNSAVVYWLTNEKCDSTVLFDDDAGEYKEIVKSSDFVLEHRVKLSNLNSGATYHFMVESVDECNNSCCSHDLFFSTEIKSDIVKPEVSFDLPEQTCGILDISVNAIDNIDVDRVLMYMDDERVFTDYSFPYEWRFNTKFFDDDEMHSVDIEGFDDNDNSDDDSWEGYFCDQSSCPCIIELNRAYDIDESETGGAKGFVVYNNEVMFISGVISSPWPCSNCIVEYKVGIDMNYDGEFFSDDDLIIDTGPDLDCNERLRLAEKISHLSMISAKETIVRPEDYLRSPYWYISNCEFEGVWDLGVDKPKRQETQVMVRAWDDDGNKCEEIFFVNNTIADPPLKDPIVTIEADRHVNYYTVKLTIENPKSNVLSMQQLTLESLINVGFQYERDIFENGKKIDPNKVILKGSQVYSNPLDDRKLDQGEFTQLEIDLSSTVLKPGDNTVITYNVVPVLYAPMEQIRIPPKMGDPSEFKYIIENYLIGDGLWVGCQGGYYPYQHKEYSDKRINLASPDLVPDPDDVWHAFKDGDYLIVTSPQNLDSWYGSSPDDINVLLTTMASLAVLKKGILGYLPGGVNADLLRGYIKNEAGNFGTWQTYLNGFNYLLLVGENEIIQSYIASWGDYSVDLTDQPFADTNDNEYPDIFIGRIIGDSPVALTRPIQASIDIHNGDAVFDRSHALLVSGTGGGQSEFVNNINNIEKILAPPRCTGVTKIHWKDYFLFDVFPWDYEKHDGFDAGDVTGDGNEEIIIADRDKDYIHIIDMDGNPVVDRGFPKHFDEGDGLAIGNVKSDGLGRDEIILSIVDWGVIYYYDDYGTWGEVGIDYDLEKFDGLASGDVMNGNLDEILIADRSADLINVFDKDGTLLRQFECDYQIHDGFAIGDVIGDGKEEIIIGDRSADKIRVYDARGDTYDPPKLLKSNDSDLEEGDGFTVGDLGWTGKQEIIVGDRNDKLRVYNFNSTGGLQLRDDEITCDFQKFDGLTTGRKIGWSHDKIILGDRNDLVLFYDEFYTDRMFSVFKDNVTDKDIIVFRDHGNTDIWAPALPIWRLPLDFVDTKPDIKPFCFSLSCLTGYYEDDDDYCITEAFFDSGVALYIGATEGSDRTTNNIAGEKFFDKYWADLNIYGSIGKAFTELEMDYIKDSNTWQRWVYYYNLYGDPTLRPFAHPLTATQLNDSSTSNKITNTNRSPPSTIEIDIPDYEVVTIQDVDYVEIPDGKILLEEEGRPMVPYYVTSIEYPSSYIIQDVILKDRSGLIIATNLTLPVVIHNEWENEPPNIISGIYPEIDYRWIIRENTNGNTTLIINMYPFYYNPDTTNVEFYKNYKFDIEYIHSDLSINNLFTNREIIKPGDEITIHIWLNNTGESMDIITSSMIKNYVTHEVIDGLPIRILKDVEGLCSYSVTWSSSLFVSEGLYYFEVIFTDNTGNTLQKGMTSFSISTKSVEEGLQIPFISGGFGISAQLENSGSENVTNLKWSITVEGNMVFLGGYKEGNIPVIKPGETYEIKSGLMLGVGPAEITVNVAGVKKTISCFLLGPFVMNIKEI